MHNTKPSLDYPKQSVVNVYRLSLMETWKYQMPRQIRTEGSMNVVFAGVLPWRLVAYCNSGGQGHELRPGPEKQSLLLRHQDDQPCL